MVVFTAESQKTLKCKKMGLDWPNDNKIPKMRNCVSNFSPRRLISLKSNSLGGPEIVMIDRLKIRSIASGFSLGLRIRRRQETVKTVGPIWPCSRTQAKKFAVNELP